MCTPHQFKIPNLTLVQVPFSAFQIFWYFHTLNLQCSYHFTFSLESFPPPGNTIQYLLWVDLLIHLNPLKEYVSIHPQIRRSTILPYRIQRNFFYREKKNIALHSSVHTLSDVPDTIWSEKKLTKFRQKYTQHLVQHYRN